jgi:hypothetical protein
MAIGRRRSERRHCSPLPEPQEHQQALAVVQAAMRADLFVLTERWWPSMPRSAVIPGSASRQLDGVSIVYYAFDLCT